MFAGVPERSNGPGLGASLNREAKKPAGLVPTRVRIPSPAILSPIGSEVRCLCVTSQAHMSLQFMLLILLGCSVMRGLEGVASTYFVCQPKLTVSMHRLAKKFFETNHLCLKRQNGNTLSYNCKNN